MKNKNWQGIIRRYWGLVILLVAAAALVIYKHQQTVVTPEERAAVEKLGWMTDFNAAQARARAEKKLLFMDFTGSDWCPYCLMLQKQVFAKPEFASYAAKNLVLLEVDFPQSKTLPAAQKAANDALAQQFNVSGFPTIVVLDSSGKTAGTLGYAPSEKEFLDDLENVRKASL
jgi:protein disulfide-isomerase